MVLQNLPPLRNYSSSQMQFDPHIPEHSTHFSSVGSRAWRPSYMKTQLRPPRHTKKEAVGLHSTASSVQRSTHVRSTAIRSEAGSNQRLMKSLYGARTDNKKYCHELTTSSALKTLTFTSCWYTPARSSALLANMTTFPAVSCETSVS